MKTDDLIVIAAAAIAVWFFVKKLPSSENGSTKNSNAPSTLPADAGGWKQDGNVMYSPDGWYYTWNSIHAVWTIAGQWDPMTGARLN